MKTEQKIWKKSWSQKSILAGHQPPKPLYRRRFQCKGNVCDHMFSVWSCTSLTPPPLQSLKVRKKCSFTPCVPKWGSLALSRAATPQHWPTLISVIIPFVCRVVPWFRRLAAVPYRTGWDSVPNQSMWNFWWTKWSWDRFFNEYLGCPLSVYFHQCSISIPSSVTIAV
jgi:hypothetical protein